MLVGEAPSDKEKYTLRIELVRRERAIEDLSDLLRELYPCTDEDTRELIEDAFTRWDLCL